MNDPYRFYAGKKKKKFLAIELNSVSTSHSKIKFKICKKVFMSNAMFFLIFFQYNIRILTVIKILEYLIFTNEINFTI